MSRDESVEKTPQIQPSQVGYHFAAGIGKTIFGVTIALAYAKVIQPWLFGELTSAVEMGPMILVSGITAYLVHSGFKSIQEVGSSD